MADVTKFCKLRPVGLLERYSTHRHAISFYKSVVLSGTYHIPPSWPALSQTQLRSVIYTALTTVIAEKPTLSAIPIHEASSAPWFVRLPTVDLDKAVSFWHCAPGEIDRFLETENNRDFLEEVGLRPFWRLTVILENGQREWRKFTACWAYHHALGDGGSGMAVHRALVAAMPAKIPANDVPQMVTPPEQELPPSQEEVLDLKIGWWKLLVGVWRLWFPVADKRTWTLQGMTPLNHSKTEVRVVTLPAETAAELVNRCRSERTTVTAALLSLIAEAFFEIVRDAQSLEFSSAISTRRWINDERIDSESIGVWVTSFDETVIKNKLKERGVWGEARRTRSSLEKMLAQRGKNTSVGLLKYMSNWTEFFMSKLGKTPKESIEVSNVGVFNGQAAGNGWVVQRMVFTQSASVTGNVIEVSVVTIDKGEMVLGVSVQEGMVKKGLVESLCDEIQNQIKAALTI